MGCFLRQNGLGQCSCLCFNAILLPENAATAITLHDLNLFTPPSPHHNRRQGHLHCFLWWSCVPRCPLLETFPPVPGGSLDWCRHPRVSDSTGVHPLHPLERGKPPHTPLSKAKRSGLRKFFVARVRCRLPNRYEVMGSLENENKQRSAQKNDAKILKACVTEPKSPIARPVFQNHAIPTFPSRA